MSVVGVEASMLKIVWPDVEKYVTKALDQNGARDYEDEARILGGLMAREMQLWVLTHNGQRFGVLVTRLHQAIPGLSMEVVLLGADDGAARDKEKVIVEAVDGLAREVGAVQIECHARPGLARVLGRYGYESLSQHMRYRL